MRGKWGGTGQKRRKNACFALLVQAAEQQQTPARRGRTGKKQRKKPQTTLAHPLSRGKEGGGRLGKSRPRAPTQTEAPENRRKRKNRAGPHTPHRAGPRPAPTCPARGGRAARPKKGKSRMRNGKREPRTVTTARRGQHPPGPGTQPGQRGREQRTAGDCCWPPDANGGQQHRRQAARPGRGAGRTRAAHRVPPPAPATPPTIGG